jgi:AcrR family transcriptional regulator
MTTKNAVRRKRVGPGRLSAEQTAELPTRLLDAALKLFSENGFEKTTMDQIAREAGASTKTIYARYANKEDVLRAVVRRIVDRTIDIHRRTAPIGGEDTDPRESLIKLCTDVSVRISTEAGPLNRMAMAESHRMPELGRLHSQATAFGAGYIREGLVHWSQRGLLPDLRPEDFELASVVCLSMTTDWTRINTSLGKPPTRAEIDRYVAFAIDLFLRGCGYRPEAAAVAKRKARKA